MVRTIRVAVWVVALCAVVPVSAQPSTGTIEGQVLDSLTGSPLPGATVVLAGSSLVVATDRTGRFRLSGAAAGPQALLVTYLGSRDARVSVSVRAGGVVSTADIKLEKSGLRGNGHRDGRHHSRRPGSRA